jgi:hypothetical protein
MTTMEASVWVSPWRISPNGSRILNEIAESVTDSYFTEKGLVCSLQHISFRLSYYKNGSYKKYINFLLEQGNVRLLQGLLPRMPRE